MNETLDDERRRVDQFCAASQFVQAWIFGFFFVSVPKITYPYGQTEL